MVQRVVFLHEDLMKLPSFPRKALEAELDLHANGEIGKVGVPFCTAFTYQYHTHTHYMYIFTINFIVFNLLNATIPILLPIKNAPIITFVS